MGISIGNGNNFYNPYINNSSNSQTKAASDNTSINNNQDIKTNNIAPVECQTCKERTYQDGSDDPSVSFKTAGHIDPDSSATVVRGHEQEHVRNESQKAESEGKEVLSQTVTLHTSTCPECGKLYVSGGETRTTIRSNNKDDYFKEQFNNFMDKNFGRKIDVKV
jgi:hypothetical protein